MQQRRKQTCPDLSGRMRLLDECHEWRAALLEERQSDRKRGRSVLRSWPRAGELRLLLICTPLLPSKPKNAHSSRPHCLLFHLLQLDTIQYNTAVLGTRSRLSSHLLRSFRQQLKHKDAHAALIHAPSRRCVVRRDNHTKNAGRRLSDESSDTVSPQNDHPGLSAKGCQYGYSSTDYHPDLVPK
jgi:hypothetical protein